jgi:putative transposase
MAFFRLLELRREGRLPPFMKKVRPPGYKKKRKSRTLWTAIRKDQYKVDGDRIVLQGLGAVGWIEVRCRGIIHLRGERGGIEIRYDADRGKWYAHIAFSKVSEKMVRGVEVSTTAAERQPDSWHRRRNQQFDGYLCGEWLDEAHQW